MSGPNEVFLVVDRDGDYIGVYLHESEARMEGRRD